MSGFWSSEAAEKIRSIELLDVFYNSFSFMPAIFIRCFNRPILRGVFLCIGTEILRSAKPWFCGPTKLGNDAALQRSQIKI